MFKELPKNFNQHEGPYQTEGLKREYTTVYETFLSKIHTLEPEVQEVLFAISPSLKEHEAYMEHPIEALQEFVEEFTFTPATMTDAATLLRVLQVKLENIDN